MSYRKSYFQRRTEEQAAIREAIKKQIELKEQFPDTSWLKVDIQAWLNSHGIKWNSSMTKLQLLDLMKE